MASSADAMPDRFHNGDDERSPSHALARITSVVLSNFHTHPRAAGEFPGLRGLRDGGYRGALRRFIAGD